MINRTYNTNSKFWLDSEDYNNFKSKFNNNNVKLSDIVDKIKILQTISNFVNIVTDSNYPVKFEGGESFSDGKSVSITAGAKDFDAVCGLSLHEASHIKYSVGLYEIMTSIQDDINSSNYNHNKYLIKLSDIITNNAKKIKKASNVRTTNLKSSMQYIHSLVNILEDYRIDSITISKFPGYAGYYKALNIDYRFNDDSNKMLASQEFTQENFKSYQIQFFGYLIDNKFNRFLELRGSDDIIKLIGNTNDFINKNESDIFNLALDIFEVILQYVTEQKELDSESQDGDDSNKSKNSNESKKNNKKSNKKDKNDSKQSGDDLDNDSNSNNESDENDESEEKSTSGNSNDESEESEESNEDESNNSGNGSNEENGDESEESNNSSNNVDLDNDGESENEDENDSDSNNSSKPTKNPKPTNNTDLDQQLSDYISEITNNPDFERIIDNINNKYEKEAITSDEDNLINLVSNNIFKIKNVKVNGKNIQVAVISEINDRILNHFPYIISDHYGKKSQTEAIKKGINIGKALGNKLVLMNDIHKSTSTRKKSGNIDSRLLAEIGAKNYKIFNKVTTTEYEDQFVHITIDTSGSMAGESIEESLQLAAAIATSSLYLKGLRVQVSIRSTTRIYLSPNNSSAALEAPYIAIIFDSKINNLNHILKYWPLITCPGATPEAITFEPIMDMILEASKNRNSYFLNICDGYPEYCSSGINYSGDTATKHGKEVIGKLLKNNIKVLVYLIDASDYIYDVVKSMYGTNNTHQIDVNNINQIAKTLNKSFLNG